MKCLTKNLIVFSSVSLFSATLLAQGMSYKSLKFCHKDYAELVTVKDESVTSVADLPPGIYLARSVAHSLENSKDKYFSYQSLLENSNPEVCYEGAPSLAIKTQSLIPTVIDQSKALSLGNTYWSLSAVLDKLTGAVHSKRSLIPNTDYKAALISQGYKIVSSQKNHDEFQLRLERNIASWKETIVITYDQF